MSKWSITRYSPSCKEEWNDLVRSSRQGTFLHLREYMDYHADRFQDCSLIASRKGRPDLILPANMSDDDILYSHQGLTYGGWLTPARHFDGEDMIDVFDAWLNWCVRHGVVRIIYKPVPHIYHRIPAEEDLYALFRFGASKSGVNLSSAIDMKESGAKVFNSQQQRNLKKAKSHSPNIRETDNVVEFMVILENCLRERHGATPVHSAEELLLLKERFPRQIRLYLCESTSDVQAAACIFDTGEVAHCQYLATTQAGRENGLLTYLLNRLISMEFANRRWFDFGTSNEQGGWILNTGLLRQKAGLGGRGIVYESYKIDL